MGKRSNFPRLHKNKYLTWDPRAVPPLLAHLRRGFRYKEPCAGAGDLIRQLEPFAHCVEARDIEPQADFIATGDMMQVEIGDADGFITNPPWTRSELHPLITHLSDQAPTWLLFDAAWAGTKQALPFQNRCRKIVIIGRLKWIPDTDWDHKEDSAWYLFDRPIPGSAPTYFMRGATPAEAPRRPVRACFDCNRPIAARDKWTLAQRGGVLTTVHRHCDNPSSYYAKGLDPIAPAPLLDWAGEAA
ncbi:hypothetical protein J2X45_003919 [Caulobacter sp. BE264]|uniref:hypothetical protein n=1 Tax=Caulobacter sp. BE264 TaxID=2817724 RepID=UPI002864DCEA|nr:hypothetical protein [Caulobacter sp. BE264]MDR7232809.1 hypothetical protein [Caulobacter sp. BE264]